MVGLVIGVIRMVMEFAYGTPSCGQEDLRPALLKDVHYLYFALILLALTGLVITAVSLCTAPIPDQHVKISLSLTLTTFCCWEHVGPVEFELCLYCTSRHTHNHSYRHTHTHTHLSLVLCLQSYGKV